MGSLKCSATSSEEKIKRALLGFYRVLIFVV
jgi:hypothetical protein